jgi:hypothetical protein
MQTLFGFEKYAVLEHWNEQFYVKKYEHFDLLFKINSSSQRQHQQLECFFLNSFLRDFGGNIFC